MKTLEKIALSLSKCKSELSEFKTPLDSKTAALKRAQGHSAFLQSAQAPGGDGGCLQPQDQLSGRVASITVSARFWIGFWYWKT